jgi:hypothetical protein
MSDQSPYQASFFIVPARIMNLPDLTLAYLRIYETIFQFWNHGKTCFLSNEIILERTGIKSRSTVKEALLYFEKHNELKRITKNGKRYLVSPAHGVEIAASMEDPVDNFDNISTKISQGAAGAAEGGRYSGLEGAAGATHNNNKLNSNNIKRESALPVDNLIKTNAEKKLEANGRIPLPDDFFPNELHFEMCRRKGLDSNLVLEKFRLTHKAKGTLAADWSSYFMKWVMDERAPTEQRQAPSNEAKSSVKFWGPGHPDYDRIHYRETAK